MTRDWKVYYNGSFWGHAGKDHSGKEIVVNKKFEWDDNTWYIPAVYACAAGLVIDFCVEIEPERIKAFVERYAALEERADKLSDLEYKRVRQESPTDISFGANVMINNRQLISDRGCGLSWIPEACMPAKQKNPAEVIEIVEHYNLDKDKGWAICRKTYRWATKSKPVLSKINLELAKRPADIYGMQFKSPLPDESIIFTHPVTGIEHVLSVQECEAQELDKEHLAKEDYEFPKCFKAMTYTLSPDIPDKDFYICDTEQSDSPRRKPVENMMSPSVHSTASIGIIGGAAGPTAIFLASKGTTKLHTACSALHFEPVDEVEWCMVFRHTACENATVEIIIN